MNLKGFLSDRDLTWATDMVFTWKAWVKQRESSVRIMDVPAENLTENLLNIRQYLPFKLICSVLRRHNNINYKKIYLQFFLNFFRIFLFQTKFMSAFPCSHLPIHVSARSFALLLKPTVVENECLLSRSQVRAMHYLPQLMRLSHPLHASIH